ncbi:IS3 family transposase [Paraglaciecola chathamensis]|uniref:Transposase n=1 Tax=Paraglaciecola agarilytica NO2 TaxID=1125747 RepID=A0ABQ0IB00_9ALTE|nr:transposase [Paraglaciecola agarilytica NO2]
MARQRHRFSAEFKLEAANLILQQGYSIPEAIKVLDIGKTLFVAG